MRTLRPLLFPIAAAWIIGILWWVAQRDAQAFALQAEAAIGSTSEASIMRFGPPPRPEPTTAATELPRVLVIPFVKNEDGAGIRSELEAQLNAMGTALEADPRARIILSGHTDADGNRAYNEALSLERAEAIKQDLVDRGFPADRISTVGRGAAHPIADNLTSAGKAKNRRVEVTLVRTLHDVN